MNVLYVATVKGQGKVTVMHMVRAELLTRHSLANGVGPL